MERIDVGAPPQGERRQRFFARATGTKFAARATEAGATELELYDEIGFWGVTAKDFRSRLNDVSGDIVLKINSPGGDVFDGIAMYNDLLAHNGRVRVEVNGLAASAASIVAMAGDEIAVAENGFLMIHNAWVLAVGNRHDLNDVASVLGKIDAALARTYANQTGLGVRTISQMMDDETWLTGAEALDKGFATEVLKPVEANAKFDLSPFAAVPAALAVPVDGGEPATPRDVEKLLMHDAGYSRSRARAVMRACKTSADEATPGAGDVGLDRLLHGLRDVNATLSNR